MDFDRQGALERNLVRQNEWLRLADAKIALLLPINTAMLAVLGTQMSDVALGPRHWVYIGLSTLPIVVSFVSAVLAAVPRFRPEGDSLIYFGDVAHRSRADFVGRVQSLTPEAHFADLAEQIHISAGFAAAKFRHVRNANLALVVALPFWIVAIYLLNQKA